jgi:UDP-N-acetylglucosamine 2-epimerase (non-hydrolysing)
MKILFFFGTRPEAIKMAPLIHEFQKRSEGVDELKICVTAQHREMLDQVLEFFAIHPDFDLDIMRPNQSLFDVTGRALQGLHGVFDAYKPDWLFVQGDTTTTFVGALAAFYEKVRVAHIEAGLRSFDKHSPFPEEMNRVLTTRLADIHFSPTLKAKENLLQEGIPKDNIFVVGNTSIDALFLCLNRISEGAVGRLESLKRVDFRKKILLVTGHRRESFGKPFENICRAIQTIARLEDIEVVYPVHLNPQVRKPVLSILKNIPNVHLINPLDYPSFVWLMHKSHVVLTDSGGVQEEAPSLGKPVLVMREVTERVEGVEAGTAKIVGTDTEKITGETLTLLRDPAVYDTMAKAANPYGDGKSSQRIFDIIRSVP